MSGIKDAKKKKGTQKAQETDSAYPADHCHDTDPDRIPIPDPGRSPCCCKQIHRSYCHNLSRQNCRFPKSKKTTAKKQQKKNLQKRTLKKKKSSEKKSSEKDTVELKTVTLSKKGKEQYGQGFSYHQLNRRLYAWNRRKFQLFYQPECVL